MEVTNNTINTLIASDGMMLTNKNYNSPMQRFATKQICLAVNDSSDNYYEVTEEEGEIINKEAYNALLSRMEEKTTEYSNE